ncbi:hypothetical protein McanMca71_003830 [Microsporum canis]
MAKKEKQAEPCTKEAKVRPDWPPLRPLPPTSGLSLTPILPSQIYIVRKLFSSALCKAYISFLSTLPLATTPGRPKKDEALRVNDRFQVDDPAFAERLWSGTGLKQLVGRGRADGESGAADWDGEVLDDEAVPVSFGTPPVRARTSWTLLIYLSTCSGGETAFYPEPAAGAGRRKGKVVEPVVVGMEAGMALLHRHGDECLLHEGREVTGGEKWVIRSDLVVKR